MAQISVPKKFERQFRRLLAQGSVYFISDIAAIDARSKSYVYQHQNYMLQFKHETKVMRSIQEGQIYLHFRLTFVHLTICQEKQFIPNHSWVTTCATLFIS
jgi:replication factor A1